MKDSKKMMKREIDFMEKKGAPKDMVKHEKAEHKSMKYAKGGRVRGDGCATKGHTKGTMR